MGSSVQLPHQLELLGYDHAKVALKKPQDFEKTLTVFGFSKYTGKIPDFLEKPYSIWGSHEAVFVIYEANHPLAKVHHERHGDTVFDLSFIAANSPANKPFVLEGAGQMRHTILSQKTFEIFPSPKGVLKFDHNTLNVDQGEMKPLLERYFENFDLEKGQFFTIRGQQTALISQVTRSKSFGVQIPFNESLDAKSQIQEFVNDHHGAGVQHLALLTRDIIGLVSDVQNQKGSSVRFLDLTDTYYEVVSKKVKIKEAIEVLKKHRIQVDQDERGGYLLQIFTQTLFGGFFFEIIQREGNLGFGEGNFQTLFEAMEIDQKRRGVL